MVVPGYTRRVGYYGRFGTGRGPRAQEELKYKDLVLSMAPSATLQSSTNTLRGGLTTDMVQGSGPSQRIGFKIIIKSIQLKLTASYGAGAVSDDTLHFWLIQDTQTNGAYAVATDVFFTGGVAFTGNNLRNMENGSRFRILKHMVFSLQSTAGVAGAFDGAMEQQSCFIKCNIPVAYNDSMGLITGVKTNSIFVVYGSSQGIAGVDGMARLRYSDK